MGGGGEEKMCQRVLLVEIRLGEGKALGSVRVEVKKVKLSPCLTNSALRHEGVWGSECVDPHFLDLDTS
jgi:hypothetical protein